AERLLRAILEGKVIANPGSRLADHEAAPAGSPAHDRRRRRRAAYSRTVHAFSGEVARVMLGRDLSSVGMRVESREHLSVGWRLRIALQRGAGEWPLVVQAVVARDDGELGLGLRFEDVDPSLKTEIERLVTNLPDIEPLGNDGEDTVRIVVSTILADESPGG
ncbi:MAG: PilZ domain-containing protein, partial [Myxococcota bacterium]